MSKTKTGQISTRAAEIYEDFFLPALFQEWAEKVAGQAAVKKGQNVLDVACGTGVLTREIFKRVGEGGLVAGLDINEGMLAVAEKKGPEIAWKKGSAESIPFPDESFERVVSQFGLMFFIDKPAAIKEMYRVLKYEGRLVVAVWDSLENAVGYQKVVGLLQRLFGKEIADALRSPYSLGDAQLLRDLFDGVGISEAEIKKTGGKARFPSIESWMFTDVKGWTLADVIDEKQYQLLLREAERELRPFVLADGTVEFDHPAYLITAEKKPDS